MSTELSPWITIAHLGRTRSGRHYSAGNLTTMVDQINREDIRVGNLGIAARARLRDDRVQVQIHWYGGQPQGVYVTPVGYGTVDGEYMEPDYRITGLKVSPWSTFSRATKL